ncbi:MAG: deazaflavin-dependent oxidoreductase (nitroreductase family) [Paracoccaceae bacterium]|jgi:deazaflavin-dependent oxidoreductase (nitroreductase family)
MTQPSFAKEHVDLYRASNGADGHIWTGFDGTGHFPCLLLTTIGRKSGEARTTPLIYGRDGDDFVVIASQGGRPAHPGWYFNIEADASVDVQVEADVFAGTARTATAEERARLWPLMAEIYPPYDAYQEKAAGDREIPVVILSRG